MLSSSGRFEAWRGAIRQGNERPIAGYGFGTEGDVFVDRYYGLDSNLTENSYVGLYLQLDTLRAARQDLAGNFDQEIEATGRLHGRERRDDRDDHPQNRLWWTTGRKSEEKNEDK